MTIRHLFIVASVLLFSLIGLSYQWAEADADGPDYWSVYGVHPGDVLNLRKGPATQFPVIARIPSDYSHLENLGCSPPFTMMEWNSFSDRERRLASSLRWCRVRYQQQQGWVKGTYLKEGDSPEK